MPNVARITLVLALGLAPSAAAAQSAVGAKVGMRFAELVTPQDGGGVEHLVAGAYYGIGLSDRVALLVEVVYGARGGTGFRVGRDELDGAEPPTRLRMRYIDVPLLLRAGFPGQRFMPSVFLGPYAGFLLGCDLVVGGETRQCQADADQRFHPRATDIGFLAGAGLDVAFGESTLFVDARHSR
jgi:hypothetical protein